MAKLTLDQVLSALKPIETKDELELSTYKQQLTEISEKNKVCRTISNESYSSQ